MRRSDRRYGMVLLMTLLLLALAAVVLAGLVRQSLRRGTEARAAQDELQRRWALVSARDTVLAQADQVFAEIEHVRDVPVCRIDARLVLGGQRFDLTLYDEQAKLNINTLYLRLDRDRTRRELQRRLSSSVREGSSVNVMLRPDRRAKREMAVVPFASWAQVFDRPTPHSLFDANHSGGRAIDHLTLWGGGRLNVWRASEDTLRSALDGVLTPVQIAALIELRMQRRDQAIEVIYDLMELSEDDRTELTPRLTDSSQCYGLLVRAGGDLEGRVGRQMYDWSVRQITTTRDNRRTMQVARFVW